MASRSGSGDLRARLAMLRAFLQEYFKKVEPPTRDRVLHRAHMLAHAASARTDPSPITPEQFLPEAVCEVVTGHPLDEEHLEPIEAALSISTSELVEKHEAFNAHFGLPWFDGLPYEFTLQRPRPLATYIKKPGPDLVPTPKPYKVTIPYRERERGRTKGPFVIAYAVYATSRARAAEAGLEEFHRYLYRSSHTAILEPDLDRLRVDPVVPEPAAAPTASSHCARQHPAQAARLVE